MALARTVHVGSTPASGQAALRTMIDLVDGYGLPLFIVGAYLAEQVALANRFMTSDGWLALLGGRRIDTLGLPHVDRWTVIADGRRWVDQQWLAQLILYRVDVLGGLRLVVFVGVLLAVGSFLGAVVMATRKGATPRALTWVVLAALVPYGRSADNLRAQSLCYPLFLALLWLLTRPRSRASYLIFPLLVLWANLHGSVAFAAVLVSGCALLRRGESAWHRTLAFAVVPWLCLLASPYANDLPRYYRALLINPAFGQYITEWKPMTLTVPDLPTYVIISAILILVGTRRSGWRREEAFILGACSVAALLAVRNGVWLALAAIVLAAPAVSRLVVQSDPAPFARRMNRLLASLVGIAVVVAVATTVTRSDGWFAGGAYTAKAADTAAAAAGSQGRVFATEEFADWLVWQHPELAGRIAFDARLELLRAAELKGIFAVEGSLIPDRALIRGYRVFVVPAGLVQVLRDSSPRRLRVVDQAGGVVILTARNP